MINKIIYTLYLFSRFRKLGDRYLISGGLFFLFFHLDILALIKILCNLLNIDFIEFFYENRLVYVLIILSFYLGSMSYAKLLIRRIKAGNLKVKKIALEKVWSFMKLSMIFFLIVMIYL